MIDSLFVDESTKSLVVRLTKEVHLTIASLEILIEASSYFTGLGGIVFHGDDLQALPYDDVSCLFGALATVKNAPLVLRLGWFPIDRTLLFWFDSLEGPYGRYSVPEWARESRRFYAC